MGRSQCEKASENKYQNMKMALICAQKNLNSISQGLSLEDIEDLYRGKKKKDLNQA